jgi:hypothetical protein
MESLKANTTSSSAFCLPAIDNGLQLANPEGKAWTTVNGTQERYFADYGRSRFDLAGLASYLKSKVTNSATELNQWFAENGWTMDLRFPPEGLGIGSIFDLLVDWEVPGKTKEIGIYIRQDGDGVLYEGCEMRPSSGLTAHKVDGHEYPMFEVSTLQPGWKVFLVESDAPCDPMDLPRKAAELLARGRTGYNFKKLKFPFVRLEADVDISWMEGMAVEGGFRIDEAVKKVRLTLDDKGARAESAVAYMMIGLESGVYTIELPFFVIFQQEGAELPAFVALSAPDSWIEVRRHGSGFNELRGGT